MAEAAAGPATGRLARRTALVLGGGHGGPAGPAGGVGIGFATATTFARHGARTVVVDRDGDAAKRTVDAIHQLGGEGLALVADVTDAEGLAAAVRAPASASAPAPPRWSPTGRPWRSTLCPYTTLFRSNDTATTEIGRGSCRERV